MPTPRISKELNDGIYFVTMTINSWYYIFDRHNRWEILADSLKYCQKNKGLQVIAYVFMLNHTHLIIQAPDVSGVIRDFKRHTAKMIIKSIRKYEPHVLDLFDSKNGEHNIWKKGNKPELIENDWFFEQKLNYVHNNPVKKQYVDVPEYWKWSSASFYLLDQEGDIKIQPLGI